MPVASVLEAPVRIADAIKKASRATGTDFDYLLKTAARESSFKTNAKASTSSATGLFQFIDNTWLQTLKEEGHRFGLGEYSDRIFKTSSGRYYVPDAGDRREILALRKDPQIAATMAGAFTRQNAAYVSSQLGREATEGELYMAHFLGPKGATRFIGLASAQPEARADSYFPKAAQSNRAIFYGGGRARTLSEVYAVLASKHDATRTTTAVTRSTATGAGEAAQPQPPEPTANKPATESATARQDPRPVEPKVASYVRRSLQITPGALPKSEPAADVARPAQPVATALAGTSLRIGPGPLLAASPVARPNAAAPIGASLQIGQGSRPEAAPGSIGAWRTIVRLEPATASAPEAAATRDEPEPIGPLAGRSPVRANARPSPSSADADAVRPHRTTAPSRPKIASSAFDYFQDDFWNKVSMGGS